MIRITLDKIICCDQGTKLRYTNSPVVDGDYIGFVTEVRPNDYEITCVRQSDIGAYHMTVNPTSMGWLDTPFTPEQLATKYENTSIKIPVNITMVVQNDNKITEIIHNKSPVDDNITFPRKELLVTKEDHDSEIKTALSDYRKNIDKSFADLYTQRPNPEPSNTEDKRNLYDERMKQRFGAHWGEPLKETRANEPPPSWGMKHYPEMSKIYSQEPPGSGGYVNKWGTRVPNPCQEIDMQGRDMDAIYRNLGPYEKMLAVEVKGNHSLWYCDTIDEAIKYANSNPESKYIRYGNVRLIRQSDNTWMNTPIQENDNVDQSTEEIRRRTTL